MPLWTRPPSGVSIWSPITASGLSSYRPLASLWHIEGVKQVVELFYPRLVLGISDEIPPDGDIERVRLVSELVQELV